MTANEQMAKVIQPTQTAGIEPVNAAILNCTEMARLSDPHDWTSKGTLTRIHAKTSSQAQTMFKYPWYLRGIYHIALTGSKQTKDKSEQQTLHLVDSPDPSSVEAEGVPEVGVDGKSLPLLQPASVGVTQHEPMVVPHMITVTTEGTFSILVGRDTLFWHSVI